MACFLCGPRTPPPPCRNGPCQICIAVADLDEEITQTVTTLQRLVAKRCDLRSEQNRVHDPIHRLPLELKNYIFQLVLPRQDQWGAIDVRHGTRIVTPSYLASICKNWRDIAWSNPFLWSTIRITLRKGTPISVTLDFVHDWILRSQNCPLTLLIVVKKATEEEWRRLLDVVGPSSNRWHSLSFDIPSKLLRASQSHNNLQYDRLRRLRIETESESRYISSPVPLLNPTMSPEEINLSFFSFRALKISWNQLTSATVLGFALESITKLFQHASRMTHCHISLPYYGDENLSMPPIIHQKLISLSLGVLLKDMAAILFGSLTLPCLQEFRTYDQELLRPPYLPAIVHRSCCPLTSIRLPYFSKHDNLQPFPGVTDLVLEKVHEPDSIKQLLQEYLPDLRYLTLRLPSFLLLWKKGIVRMFLDRKGTRPDSPNEGRLHKILVVDEDHAAEFHDLWTSDVGKELKALDIVLKEDGFEIVSQIFDNPFGRKGGEPGAGLGD